MAGERFSRFCYPRKLRFQRCRTLAAFPTYVQLNNRAPTGTRLEVWEMACSVQLFPCMFQTYQYSVVNLLIISSSYGVRSTDYGVRSRYTDTLSSAGFKVVLPKWLAKP